eukprot:SAG31_NODE_29026_length_402_cov_0.570957_1_plen_39_part_10
MAQDENWTCADNPDLTHADCSVPEDPWDSRLAAKSLQEQ